MGGELGGVGGKMGKWVVEWVLRWVVEWVVNWVKWVVEWVVKRVVGWLIKMDVKIHTDPFLLLPKNLPRNPPRFFLSAWARAVSDDVALNLDLEDILDGEPCSDDSTPPAPLLS